MRNIVSASLLLGLLGATACTSPSAKQGTAATRSVPTNIAATTATTRELTIQVSNGPFISGDYVKIMTDQGNFLAGGQVFRVTLVDGTMQMSRQARSVREKTSSVTLEVTEAQATEITKGKSPTPEKNYLLISPPPVNDASGPKP